MKWPWVQRPERPLPSPRERAWYHGEGIDVRLSIVALEVDHYTGNFRPLGRSPIRFRPGLDGRGHPAWVAVEPVTLKIEPGTLTHWGLTLGFVPFYPPSRAERPEVFAFPGTYTLTSFTITTGYRP